MNFNFLSIANPTGGLRYHLRALLHRQRWQPFCDMVEAWLNEWSADVGLGTTDTLILIGPNAGYTLPPSFLEKFRKIIIVEPDPLAYLLFRSRFSLIGINISWLSRDFFGVADGVIRISDLFKLYPHGAFLFCNILGQLPLLLKKNKKINVELYMKNLGQILLAECSQKNDTGPAPLNLASYHDRYSTSRFFPNEIVDHLTGELFNDSGGLFVKREFPWRLTRIIEHQIEFVYIKSRVKSRQRSGN